MIPKSENGGKMAEENRNENPSHQDLIETLRGAQADLAAGYETLAQAHDEAQREKDEIQREADEVHGKMDEIQRERDEIQKEKDLFEEIFSGSREAIFLVDSETAAIVRVNSKACKMLGYSHEELTSMSQPDLYPADSRPG